MDDSPSSATTDLALRVGSGALTGLGVVAVLFGYLGVRDEPDIALQIPYLFSGGLGGLVLIGLGAMCLIQLQMRRQADRMARITDDLDEWKDAALGEIRSFLASAVVEIDLDVDAEQDEVIRAPRRVSNRHRAGTGHNGSSRREQPLEAG